MHATISLILNDRFVDAYRDGFILKCGDGHYRRLFPRILMYSADYPEKYIYYVSACLLSINAKTSHRTLLSTIKSNAEHPCPRCLVKKVDTIKMGMRLDMHYRHTSIRIDNHPRQTTVEHARRLVFEQGIPLSSSRLKGVLDKNSGVPTRVCPPIHDASPSDSTNVPVPP
jgi:hypothetical protein